MGIHFSELRYPQIQDAAKKGAVVVLPFGQIEEHGPHLPIHTDAFIAERVCEEAVRQLAKSKGIPYPDLIRQWVREKIEVR